MARWRAWCGRFIKRAIAPNLETNHRMPRAAKTKTSQKAVEPTAHRAGDGTADIAADLSYNEARAALELALAELQSSELDVEAMAALYQRAQAYANRCQAVLDAVEQEVLLWDASDPSSQPERYQP